MKPFTLIGLYFLMLSLLFPIVGCRESKSDVLFTLLDEDDTQLTFNNRLFDSPDFNVMKYGYFYNGGGVAAADFNNDGFTDIYFSGNIENDKLYINKANGKIEFDDKTKGSGLSISDGWNTGVSIVDINEDGWLDIYVCRSAAETSSLRSNLLYINNGDLTFTEKAKEYGLDDTGYSTQAVFFDYDKDGDTDCFILNHSVQKYAGFSQNLANYKSSFDPNYSSRLMQNNGNNFTDVTEGAGLISNVLSFGLGVMVSDFNGDGWSDIYVSNDYNEEDYLYINQHDGSFGESIRSSTAYTSLFSMGSDAADINNDGMIDFITLDMLPESNERIKLTSGDDNFEKYQNLLRNGFHKQSMRNMLQLNTGNQLSTSTAKGIAQPLFQEIGQISGISNTDWSWSALFGDYDMDGLKDLFITNGYEKDYTNMEFMNYTVDLQTKIVREGHKLNEIDVINKMPSIREHNYIFKNTNGTKFENKVAEWGLSEVSISAGSIQADLDNDGDLDLVVNNINQNAFVYQNNANSLGNHFLGINLQPSSPSLQLGSKIYVFVDGKIQLQEFMPVRGFQSSAYTPLIFGLGTSTKVDSVRIQWSDGTWQSLENIQIDAFLNIQKSENKALPYPYKNSYTTTLSDFPFVHQEDMVNDFSTQPLLPSMISYQGPHIAVSKNENDRLIYICGAAGQAGALFSTDGATFTPKSTLDFIKAKDADESDAVFVDYDNDGDEDLIVVSSGYLLSPDDNKLLPRFYKNGGKGQWTEDKNALKKSLYISASSIVALDYDKDGDQDIFIGSRVIPNRFPEGGLSVLLSNNGNGIFDVVSDTHYTDLGMITDAEGADLDGDGYEEIVISREFNKVSYIKNLNGKVSLNDLVDISQDGWWKTIHIADINKDGKPDILAGNIGQNNQWHTLTDGGLKLYSGSFFNIAKDIPVVSVEDKGKHFTYASRDELLMQIPSLKKKYGDYSSFAKATIEDIFGDELGKTLKGAVSTFQTAIWINTSTGFQNVPLPHQAQNSPIYSILAEDINKDGSIDIILGGNDIHTRVRIGDQNSSYGTILLNNGNGEYIYQGELGIKGQIRNMVSLKNKNKTSIIFGLNNGQAKYFVF